MGTGKEGELQEAKVAEAGNEEKYNEEEREGTPGSQTGLVSVAESGNPGKFGIRKRRYWGKASNWQKSWGISERIEWG